ncbi:plasmid recombination protein [Enterococcus faecium]|uniref:plasmid recombination protein n=1 Tax=Enterococcus faecium TaxID=1352 RepID=UPI000F6698BC|nr:plasmid recombination protein [Enterococcus faecium]RSA48215.1 hypothetical protein EGK22_13090 [Enterococcus faecium]RSA56369.1 hypothetical protein EGK28_13205 [Enterococcus faecium]RSA64925.1 hypothetical protein EGK42_13035 [Enterococcus faecium]
MAHVAKYTRGGIQGLSNHLDRKTENHANKDIDVSKSHLNYDLNQNQGDTISRLNERFCCKVLNKLKGIYEVEIYALL